MSQIDDETLLVAQNSNEFEEGGSLLSHPADRRNFIKLMGASVALAGVSGCSSIRKPEKRLVPYVKQPEYLIPGKSTYYSSTFVEGELAYGVLIESHEGRPTKLEGNPAHSMSNGAATARAQASLLGLYDPDRLKSITYNKSEFDKEAFRKWVADLNLSAESGRGVGILIPPTISPTEERLISALKNQNSELSIYTYEPVNRDNQTVGLLEVTGRRLSPLYDYTKSDVVVSFGCDFLGEELTRLSDAKDFANRRDPDSGVELNRSYVFESTYSISGGSADHRLTFSPSETQTALLYIATQIAKHERDAFDSVFGQSGLAKIKQTLSSAKTIPSQTTLDVVVKDILKHAGKSLLLVGREFPPSIHALVYGLNQALGNAGNTVNYAVDNRPKWQSQTSIAGLKRFVKDAQDGQLKTLFVLGGDPAYNTPGDSGVVSALKSIETVVSLSQLPTQTTALAQWVIPQSHYLEAWGDAKSYDNSVSLAQPLITPLYDSFSVIEMLLLLHGSRKSDYTAVRETHMGSAFQWKKWLHNGVVASGNKGASLGNFNSAAFGGLLKLTVPSNQVADKFTLIISSDHSIYDGRYVNSSWLQELPDPITKLTWDNALLISPKSATRLGVHTEDVVKIKTQSGEIEAPVYIAEGQSDSVLALSLGYGQTVSGRLGQNTGVNAYRLLSTSTGPIISGVSITLTNKNYPLASSQMESSMHDRPIYREGTVSEYKAKPKMFSEMVEHPPLKSLWEERNYDTGNQWGMTIDLNKCTGCNACVIACQSENNIPVVGKQQVIKGRIMHWIRMDRYFTGDSENPNMVHQPVACMQCENAPCEQVCPVAATVHDNEGLNAMVYNRCIGTRYCSNNCPYKVRRFNFFDWHQKSSQSETKERTHLFDYFREQQPSVKMAMNPDVTVRMRGVMEKCTYCTQRIQEVKSTASNENRPIKDGEILTACQQTCPTSAIVFGNINDKNSTVSKERNRSRNYALLSELNTKPRTLYLASVKNPNSALVKDQGEQTDHGHH
ncbi:MAG: 4Fe-4S dicluster domain-containing protein [bacterium]|nr:4Fe-4S dicluster domain-containing protein [bacterium]